MAAFSCHTTLQSGAANNNNRDLVAAMSKLLDNIQETERNLLSTLLAAVSHVGQKAICEGLGKDKSSISKFFSGEKSITLSREDFLKIIQICELKLIDHGQVMVDQKVHESYKILAQKWLNHEMSDGDDS